MKTTIQKNKETFKVGKLSDRINKKFIPLFYCKDRYIVCYGSRNSSKSDFVAFYILMRMISDPYFKGLAIRLIADTIKDSTFDTMMKVISRYNLESYFHCTVSPMKIRCVYNKNVLLFKGLDKPGKLKSISDPSFIWWEEEMTESESDWNTISTSLRSNKAPIIQEIFTINPVIENYEEHWFYQKFFSNETELEFRKEITKTIDGVKYSEFATIHHSTHRDNRWLDPNAKIKLELLANGNEYDYITQGLGLWANKAIEGRLFSRFNITKHVSYKEYDSNKPLHISFDFNRRPYSAATIYQVYVKQCVCIDEICVLNKDLMASPIKQTCMKFKEKYPDHQEGIYVYGDPSGRQEDSKSEKGYNDYRIITDELTKYKPQLRIQSAAPSVKKSSEFVNEIFESNFNEMTLWINGNCRELMKDLQYLKMDKEGGKLIEKIKDSDGAQIEKYGHTSDTLRYFMTTYFDDGFAEYKNPSSDPVDILVRSGKRTAGRHAW